VTLRARWVTLRARWVTLRARWVTLRARWVTLRACWVTPRARWVTLRARWVTPVQVWSHYGEIETYGGRSIDMRTEVGLLSRNVVVQGDWSSQHSQHGAHIMLSSPGNNSLTGRFSNVECRFCGQAFKLGRYPIHFHMVGEVYASYVSNCSVHDTFNRAVTIHGVHRN
jgi:hypothetical protein